MKKIILLIAAIVPMAVYAQTFVLKGKIGQLNAPAKVYLVYTVNDKDVHDSATLKNGEFSFNGTVTDPAGAALYVSHDGSSFTRENYFHWDKLSFYLEKGIIEVNSPDSVKYAVVNGGEMNAEYKKLHEMLAAVNKQMDDFNRSVSTAPYSKKQQKVWQDEMTEKQRVLHAAKNNILLAYVKQNPQALLSVVALQQYAGDKPDLAVIQPLFDALAPAVKESPRGKAFATLLQNTGIGGMAPDFTQVDTAGKLVKLYSYRGKYVLLDFWASWCGPCRGENPNVAKAYAAYHHRNFDILGVSLDNNRASWLKAIQADGLTWAQASDLGGWKNQAARLYSVTSIPQNFLIDPTGKIIGRNLRGEDLEKKLDEVLPK